MARAEAREAQLVNWQMPIGGTFDDAKTANKPLVFFFVEKDDEATRDMIRGPKISPLSKEKANFILVVKPAPVELPAEEAKPAGPTITSGGKAEKKSDDAKDEAKEEAKTLVQSPIPMSKLLSADFWEAYGVKDANTVVVTDWFGNEKNRFGRAPSESSLIKTIESVPAAVEADAKALAGDLEKLEKFMTGDNEAKPVKQALKIFKRGLVGHDSMAKVQEHYGKLLESGKAKMATLEAANDVKGLRSLRSAFRDTEIEGEVSDAVSRVQASVSAK